MAIQRRRRRVGARVMVLGILLAAAWVSTVSAQGDTLDGRALVEKVAPAIVTISVDNSGMGSGFVVDAASGLVATNYHVIERAKQLTVSFPADKDEKGYAVEGFVAVLPGKDLALIRIKAGDKKLQSLKLAEKSPAIGERVYAFGVPLGLGLSFTEGPVTAVRSGREVSLLVAAVGGDAFYEGALGYDLDATWVQHTVAISPGTGGGPLVNSKGEVVAINTWVYGQGTTGPNLNFSISSTDLAQFIAKVGTKAQPLSNLPPPRHRRHSGTGNPEKTLAAWKAINRATVEFNKKLTEAENSLKQAPALDRDKSEESQEARNKALSAAYKQFARAYTDLASKVAGTDPSRTVETELLSWTVKEGDLLRRAGGCYRDLAMQVLTDPARIEFTEGRLSVYKEMLERLRAEHDLLRASLEKKSLSHFPTLAETEKELDAAAKAEPPGRAVPNAEQKTAKPPEGGPAGGH